MRWRWATALLLAIALTGLGAAPASADVITTYAQNTRVYADETVRHLASIHLQAQQGDTFFVRARLQAEHSSHRILAALRLNCLGGAEEVRTTQNLTAGQARAVLNARYVFTAPSDGTFECRLETHARIPGYGSIPAANFSVNGSESFIRAASQPDWARHGYQASRVLTKSGQSQNVAALPFTAPEGVNSFGVIADVELTNCYGDSGLCETIPRNTRDSVVGTRLVVMQRDGSGGFCNVTRYPASGRTKTTITWLVHHKKAYHSAAGVPVSRAPGCTRNFRIKVITTVLSGNDVLVEPKPWTNVMTRR